MAMGFATYTLKAVAARHPTAARALRFVAGRGCGIM
jgi:hypothetical protein